jgi:hypothetical protein
MKKIAMALFYTALIALIALVGSKPVSAAESDPEFSISQSSNSLILKKNETVSFDVTFAKNSQDLYLVDFNILYDTAQFDLEGFTKGSESYEVVQRPEVVLEGDRVFVQYRLYQAKPISAESGTLLNFSLKSVKGAASTTVNMQVVSIIAQDKETKKAYAANYSLGNPSVSFTRNLIPTWVWIVLGVVLAVSIIVGYLLNMFFGTKINKAAIAAAVRTKQLAMAAAERTQRIFKRRPQAPKLKASDGKATQIKTPGTSGTSVKSSTTAKTDSSKSDTTKK